MRTLMAGSLAVQVVIGFVGLHYDGYTLLFLPPSITPHGGCNKPAGLCGAEGPSQPPRRTGTDSLSFDHKGGASSPSPWADPAHAIVPRLEEAASPLGPGFDTEKVALCFDSFQTVMERERKERGGKREGKREWGEVGVAQ
ncbi:hypothetical protein EYF80_029656 [Liparis tanakae]|uniref:Uncharacterized protein n=1 Tax=Liparis tanakae TaxID=230148 RepID=A0A4Z2H5J6_9TELE|nr:hypothetical protein EYF80_029656 [Liparis tanakae]